MLVYATILVCSSFASCDLHHNERRIEVPEPAQSYAACFLQGQVYVARELKPGTRTKIFCGPAYVKLHGLEA